MRFLTTAVKTLPLLAVLGLVPATPGLALTTRVTPQGIPYVSGGVGMDERAEMDAVAGQYNLRLEFARSDGAYLGDVRVAFRGTASGDIVTDGPVLLLRLPAGSYTVTAVSGGVPETRQLVVGASGPRAATFIW
ncbi:hypothetical protein DesfrDRAFT_4089 [Solidesulfovibrio fructosivorans JJ]]|uniref:Carboxypeptidase regulatory-like domain-containing protein n=1 Tax=Solidesulfovibrio fructosivorans JJ] TaxID=596151 RepID=E1K2I9_SOLFR|nr:hypothetical protein [Solidesulfovibrio fructosivorans]EFL49172.1 hypothetical protein DesfrDRAFT_4089 [Solidesulfovibrio fructosivorans JJ]]